MSGGSLGYLYTREPCELFEGHNVRHLEEAAAEAYNAGYKDVAKDIYRLVEYINSANIRVEVLHEQLADNPTPLSGILTPITAKTPCASTWTHTAPGKRQRRAPAMAERYKSLYRCRLCGKKYHGLTSAHSRPDAMSYMVNHTVGVRGVYANEPTQLHVHECDNGGLGVAEFLGMEKALPAYMDMDERTESGLLEDD